MDATLTTHPPTDVALGAASHRPRLAELVVHLTGCSAPLAVAAVNRVGDVDAATPGGDPLAVVAAALVAVRRIDLRDGPVRPARS